jgi:hypothetical protein
MNPATTTGIEILQDTSVVVLFAAFRAQKRPGFNVHQ